MHVSPPLLCYSLTRLQSGSELCADKFHCAAAIGDDSGHGEEEMRHARMARIGRRYARIAQGRCVGETFVTKGIAFRRMNEGRRKIAEIREPQRRDSGIRTILTERKIMIEIPIDHFLFNQVTAR